MMISSGLKVWYEPVAKESKVIYLQGYKTDIKVGGTYLFPAPGGGEKIRGKVVSVDLKDSKLRNASGSLIPMPQTAVTIEVLPAKKDA